MHPAHRLFAREGPVKCKQHFIPAANQSVIVTVSLISTGNPPAGFNLGARAFGRD